MTQPSTTLPAGVIFDMDGVLVDSEPFIAKAGCMMFAEHGLTVQPDDFLPFVGTGENRYLGGVAEKYGFPIVIERDKKRTYEIYLEIIKGQLQPLPGVHDFIAKCQAAGKKLALATSADWIKAEGNLREISLAANTFAAIVTADVVTHKKPHPEIFVTAAAKLGLDPKHCLVVEDAVNGVAAARAGGARCLALTTTFTADELSDADWCASTLADAPDDALAWPDYD